MIIKKLLQRPALSKKLISWQMQYGRHHLPWQQDPSPYRVWISEIMLQQTQVETVKAYYIRFMQRFPTVFDLAKAQTESVLQLWSGLGYYARARHLHQTAQIIVEAHQGKFPEDLAALIQLPGIGGSTAGAILSLSMQQSAAILDGNVRRVLARIYAIKVWPAAPQIAKQMWEIARHHTPSQQAHIYNQALMDLGAMICTPKAPQCPLCPLRNQCLAYQQDLQTAIPVSKPKKELPQKHGFMLVLYDEKNNAILLEKRKAPGIWGGLWCFPECPKPGKSFNDYLPKDAQLLSIEAPMKHTFTHYRWHITPIIVKSKRAQIPKISGEHQWYALNHSTPLALAAAVKRLLASPDYLSRQG